MIRDAMKDKDRVALARIVMANREHVIAIEPMGKGMLGTTLRFPYELREEKPYFSGIRSPRGAARCRAARRPHPREQGRALRPAKFKDEYESALKALIRRKAKGHTIEVPEERASRATSST